MLKPFGVRTLGANRTCKCGAKLERGKDTIWEVVDCFFNHWTGRYVCKMCATKHLQEQTMELAGVKAQ